MKIIGCDLHAAQQTIAMLDRETGEIVETDAETRGRDRAGILRGLAGTGPGRARSHRLHGMVSAAARRTRHHVPGGTSGDDPKSGDAQTETRPTRCGVAAAATERRIGFRRSGYPRPSCGICGPCCCTGTSGCVCGRACRMRCTRSRSGMACSADTRCGIETARRCWRRCRCHRTPRIAAMNCRRCISSWMSRSIGLTTE